MPFSHTNKIRTVKVRSENVTAEMMIIVLSSVWWWGTDVWGRPVSCTLTRQVPSLMSVCLVSSILSCLQYSRWMKSLSISGSGTRLDRRIMTVWDHSHIQKLWGQLDCTKPASTDSLISVSECLSRLFLRFSVFLLRSGERGVQVDPRSEPSLSWSSHYAGGHEVWPERRPRRNWTFEGEGTDICQWGIGKRHVSTNISDFKINFTCKIFPL